MVIGLSVGYETRSPIGCHQPFGIAWCKCRLGCLVSHCIVKSCDPWEFWPFFRRNWQSLYSQAAVRAVQDDWERVYRSAILCPIKSRCLSLSCHIQYRVILDRVVTGSTVGWKYAPREMHKPQLIHWSPRSTCSGFYILSRLLSRAVSLQMHWGVFLGLSH